MCTQCSRSCYCGLVLPTAADDRRLAYKWGTCSSCRETACPDHVRSVQAEVVFNNGYRETQSSHECLRCVADDQDYEALRAKLTAELVPAHVRRCLGLLRDAGSPGAKSFAVSGRATPARVWLVGSHHPIDDSSWTPSPSTYWYLDANGAWYTLSSVAEKNWRGKVTSVSDVLTPCSPRPDQGLAQTLTGHCIQAGIEVTDWYAQVPERSAFIAERIKARQKRGTVMSF